MTAPVGPVVHVDEMEEHAHLDGDHWGGTYRVLTPSLRPQGGRLGVNLTRLPPGRALCPFHHHAHEDEVFYVVSGRGVLRYGDALYDIGPGHCISCPAGTGVAHQIANPYDEDLLYLAIGDHNPNEVCGYPDTGKVLIRSLKKIGYLEPTAYAEGEPDRPKVFDLIDARGR